MTRVASSSLSLALAMLLLLLVAAALSVSASPFYPSPLVVQDSQGGYTLQKSQSADPLNWMADTMSVIGDRTLQHVTLPGTHDAGAYWLSSQLEPNATGATWEAVIKVAEELGIPINDVITPWALAQSVSIYDQLRGGIRYIDMRACWNGTAWHTFHFELGVESYVMLQDMAKFLSQQPGEVIVVEVSHFDGNPNEQQRHMLAQMIQQTLGQYLFPSAGGFNATIKQMVTMNQRAVVTFGDSAVASQYSGLWPSSTIANSYANSDKLDTMISYNEKMVAQFNGQSWPIGNLYKISWTLTPAADCILKGILPGEPHSLKELADTAAPKLPTFASEQLTKKLRIGNILIIDHFQTSQVLQVAINSNAALP